MLLIAAAEPVEPIVVAAPGAGAKLPVVDRALGVVDQVGQADCGEEETDEEDFHSAQLVSQRRLLSLA